MCVYEVHLDEGLVTEILLRLPARSVLRFRAVCKDWLRITACPSFVAAHARRRPLEVLLYTTVELVGDTEPRRQRVPAGAPFFPRFSRIGPSAPVYVEVDAVSVTAHRPAARRRLARYQSKRDVHPGSEYCRLLSSRDGLLLLRSGGAVEQYLVCNPVTRQWSNLPGLSSDAGADHKESGFYFHEPSREYRLLCHVTFYQPQPVDWGYYVLSTGGDEPRRLKLLNRQATPMWNTLSAIPSELRTAFYDNLMTPAVLHGHLHWMRHMEAGLTDQMVAFDTVTETFRRMRPPPITPRDLVHSQLLVADGSLIVSDLDHLHLSVDLWVLKGYDGGAAPGRWERRHRVRVEAPCHRDNRLLVGTGGDGGDVILGTPAGVVAYNMRSRTVRQVVGIDASRGNTVSPSRHVFRESLMRHGFFDARPHPGLPLFSFRA